MQCLRDRHRRLYQLFVDPLNNFSVRPELYYDPQEQRTGTARTYYAFSIGWQHWLSPQIALRPEIGYYRSNGANAFSIGTKNYTVIAASDIIGHFYRPRLEIIFDTVLRMLRRGTRIAASRFNPRGIQRLKPIGPTLF